MMTWSMFLSDEAGERLVRGRSVAIGLSVLLHAGVVSAALLELPPQNSTATGEYAIDVTFQPAPRDDDVTASETLVAALRVEREESVPSTASTPALPSLEQAVPSIDSPPSVDAHEFANARPVEELLPPVEAPPHVDAREFAAAAPASAPAGKQARQQPAQVAAMPTPPARQPIPDTRPRNTTTTAAHTPPAQPKDDQAQSRAEEDYFWQIVRRISQYRFASNARQTSEHGMVVTRMTIARDGRLLDVGLLRSSGSPTLDSAVLGIIRQASPFAPLPAEMAQMQQTFVVPVRYTRER